MADKKTSFPFEPAMDPDGLTKEQIENNVFGIAQQLRDGQGASTRDYAAMAKIDKELEKELEYQIKNAKDDNKRAALEKELEELRTKGEAERQKRFEEICKSSKEASNIAKAKELYDKNQDEFTKLYNQFHSIMSDIVKGGGQFNRKKDATTDDNVRAAALDLDTNGKLRLRITLLQPAGTSFSVSDGKVSFDAKDMNRDQMLAMIEFLQSNGLPVDISKLKLEDANDATKEMFSSIVQELKQEYEEQPAFVATIDPKNPDSADVRKVDEIEGGDEIEEPQNPEGKTSKTTEGENFEVDEERDTRTEETPAPRPSPTPAPKMSSKDSYEKDVYELYYGVCDAISENWNKQGYENFRWRQGRASGGWTTFTMWPCDNVKPFRKEAEIDPDTGDVKVKYDRQFGVRVKNGNLEVFYSGKMGDNEFYEFVSQLYANGIKYVRFVGLPEEDESKFRIQLAKRLMIPVGHNISQERYLKMTKAAGDKIGSNNPKYYRYRYDLAQEMRRQQKAKGIDDPLAAKNRSIPECREIRWAESAYRLYPFRNMWEDVGAKGDKPDSGRGLRYVYEDILDQANSGDKNKITTSDGTEVSGAALAIGAKLAVTKLYNIYEKYSWSSLQDLMTCSELNDKEKNAIKSYTTAHGTDLNVKMHDMDPLIYEGLFKTMCDTQAVEAKKQIEDAYVKNLEAGASENPERSAVSKCWKNAQADLDKIRFGIHECDIPELRFEPGGIPDHDFSEKKKEPHIQELLAERAGRRKGGHPATPRSGALTR